MIGVVGKYLVKYGEEGSGEAPGGGGGGFERASKERKEGSIVRYRHFEM